MKKLTKTLSLVLVVAMVLSLCVIGASATFTDNSKVTADYSEAVTIMTDLKVVSGYPDGSFKPAGTLTRAEACVLMSNMTLGSAAAAALVPTTVTFKDVPTSYWGYKYVEYCYQAGYIAGTGNGNFSPTATLTGYQWALMLMRIRGYDMTSLTTGNWQINTAKVYYAADTKFSDVAISSTAVTRESATQMAYDALFTSLTGKTGYPVMNGTSVVAVYDTVAEAIMMCAALNGGTTLTTSPYQIGAAKVTMGTDYMAKTVFGVSLNGTGANTADVYGRPSNVYTTDTKAEATTYGWATSTYSTAAKVIAKSAVLTYTAAVTGSALKLAIANAGYTVGTSLVVETNGVAQTAVDGAAWLNSNLTTSLGGNGCLIELYASTSKVVNKIVVVNTWVAAVASITKDNTATTTVDERALSLTVSSGFTTYATPATTEGFDAVYTAAVAAQSAGKTYYALVVPTYDNQASAIPSGSTSTALMVAAPDTQSVTATSYSTASFTAGGTTFKYSKNHVGSVGSFAAQTVLLDKYGYVILATETASAGNYAYVVNAVLNTSSLDGGAAARLLLTDGTTKDVTLALTAAHDSIPAQTIGDVNHHLVTYTVNANGTYTLVDSMALDTEGTTAVAKNQVSMTLAGTTTGLKANNSTVFLVKTTSAAGVVSYNAYTGISTVPTITKADGAAYALNSTTGYASVVYVENATTTGSGVTATDVIFVDADSQVANTVYGVGTVYTYDAIVNGTITTINSTVNVTKDAIYITGTKDATTGYYTSLTEMADTTTVKYTAAGAAVTNEATYSLVKLNGTEYTYTADTAVYYINAAGTITSVGAAGVTTDTNDAVTYYTTNGVLTFAVISYVTNIT